MLILGLAFSTANCIGSYTESSSVIAELRKLQWSDRNLLMMSSGNFNGLDFADLADELM